jgi:hypothetical protein
MLTHSSHGTVIVINNESGALSQAILIGKSSKKFDVNLKGVPLTFRRINNRYVSTYSDLSFELVSG